MFDVEIIVEGRPVTRKSFNYTVFDDVLHLLRSGPATWSDSVSRLGPASFDFSYPPLPTDRVPATSDLEWVIHDPRPATPTGGRSNDNVRNLQRTCSYRLG